MNRTSTVKNRQLGAYGTLLNCMLVVHTDFNLSITGSSVTAEPVHSKHLQWHCVILSRVPQVRMLTKLMGEKQSRKLLNILLISPMLIIDSSPVDLKAAQENSKQTTGTFARTQSPLQGAQHPKGPKTYSLYLFSFCSIKAALRHFLSLFYHHDAGRIL